MSTKRSGSGKNSSIDGPWNSPSSVAVGTSRFTALASSAISCFGAWSGALASTNMEHGSAHMPEQAGTWGISHTLARSGLRRIATACKVASDRAACACAEARMPIGACRARARPGRHSSEGAGGTARRSRRAGAPGDHEHVDHERTDHAGDDRREEHDGFQPVGVAQHHDQHDEQDELQEPSAEHDRRTRRRRRRSPRTGSRGGCSRP